MYSRISNTCYTGVTRRLTLEKNPVLNLDRERGILTTTNGTYKWSSVSQIFCRGWRSHGGDRKVIEMMT
jgi:hypothetical protein